MSKDFAMSGSEKGLVTAATLFGIQLGALFLRALADRRRRIPLQILGFVGCAVGLVVAAAGSAGLANNVPVIIVGFFLFQLMTNLGPNAQTYLLAGEVFPTPLRGLGAGIAAATGKVGAVITWVFQIETAGVEIDRNSANGLTPGRQQRALWRWRMDGAHALHGLRIEQKLQQGVVDQTTAATGPEWLATGSLALDVGQIGDQAGVARMDRTKAPVVQQLAPSQMLDQGLLPLRGEGIDE